MRQILQYIFGRLSTAYACRRNGADTDMTIGCHLSAAAGYAHMARQAHSIGADTFQFFTRNPRGGRAKAEDPSDTELYPQLAAEYNIKTITAHAPYTLNLCSADASIREFGRNMMAEDLSRLKKIPGCMYNFHPGSHVGQGEDVGIQFIIAALNTILTPEQTTPVLLETMAGKGSEIGSTFEQLRRIIDGVELSDKLGVCMDTCHVYDAGYDIVSQLDKVLCEFDRTIGLERLKAIHLNDTKNPFASHKDRHEVIGKGYLTLKAIEELINAPELAGLPFILETPNDLDGYAREISLIKSMRTVE